MERGYTLIKIDDLFPHLIETQQFPVLQPAQLYANQPLPLNSRCIRVIDISTDDQDLDAPLRGSLRVVNLKDCPRFAALSYVWGGHAPVKDTIHCNGCDLPITRNCRDAIVSLRSRHRDLTIWIDAICINQADGRETTRQIQMMEEIYTWAQTVYVWLGHGTLGTTNAMDCLRLTSTFRTEMPGIPWADTRGPRTARQDTIQTTKVLLGYFIRSWVPFVQKQRLGKLKRKFDPEDLNDLLGREWIRRAWTFQEIILASNPVIVCGDEELGWGHLLQALDYLYDTQGFFRVDTWRFVKEFFSYEIQHDTEMSETSELSRMARSLASFDAWRTLSNLWTLTYRPNRWNEKEFRQLPKGVMPALTHHPCSVRDYQRRINIRKAWHHTKVLMAVISFVMLLTLVVMLVHSIVGTRGSFCWWNYLLFGAAEWLDDSTFALIITPTLFAISVLFGAFVMAYMIRLEPHFWSDEHASAMPLIGLVRALRERRATIARDKANALHGVLHSLNISHTKADYEMPLGEVYRHLFLDLLRFKPAVISLLIDVGPASLPGVPSWVPNWSAIEERQWLKSEQIYSHLDLYDKTLPEPQMKIEDDTIGLWSELKDTISYCTAPLSEEQRLSLLSNDRSQGEVLKVIGRWLATTVKRACSQSHSVDGDLIADVILACVPGVQDQHINALLKCFERFSQRAGGHAALQIENHESVSCKVLQALQEVDAEDMRLAVECCRRLASTNGRVFVSREGHVGLGPLNMEEGDTIALVRGVAVPMVLRQSDMSGAGDRYTVVGPAYVHGMMDLSEFNAASCGARWTAVYLV